MATRSPRFNDLVEIIDRLPVDERATLIDVIRQRMAQDEHDRVAASIRAARREHVKGRTRPVTPEELLKEILE